jgi:hypothetical protein
MGRSSKPSVKMVSLFCMLAGAIITKECVFPDRKNEKAISNTPAITQPQELRKNDGPESESPNASGPV